MGVQAAEGAFDRAAFAAQMRRLRASLDESRLPRHIAVMADGNRRSILRSIRSDSLPVGAIAEAVGLSQQTTSHHLGVLRKAGLAVGTREGNDALAKELRDHVAKVISPIAKPASLLFTADLPKTRSGKIMRRLLRDVAEGDKTLLNRKRTRYWAFFDRVKRQVSKQWSPVTEYRKRDPYGNVFGVKDRYSTVDFTLNGDGSLRRLYLSRASGLDFFDDEAVRALQSAAPFHNPPEGLKDEDGLVHFTFGFYFEIASGSFRFMRINR